MLLAPAASARILATMNDYWLSQNGSTCAPGAALGIAVWAGILAAALGFLACSSRSSPSSTSQAATSAPRATVSPGPQGSPGTRRSDEAPASLATATSACSGIVSCSSGPCPVGTECFRLTRCAEPVCVTSQRACEIDCGVDARCDLLKSSPPQVACLEGGAKQSREGAPVP